MNRKMLYWGPFPWEQDGGAVVNYYNILMQNQLSPRDEYWGYSKVPEELDPSYLPWVNFPMFKHQDDIPGFMFANNIPLLNIFHVGVEDFEKQIDKLKGLGVKSILHQTIHWKDDAVTKSTKLKEFDMIVAPTQYAKEVFIGVCKLPADKIKVIPHGIDTMRYYRRPTALKRALGIRPEQKVILFSGRLSFWKGVQEIIPIMRKLYNKYDCVFIIRGGAFSGNKESMALYKVFDKLQCQNVIFLPKWQSPQFMEELYAMTDILVFNAAHEGFGVPLIEAQSVGAVPITTALDNHLEICGTTGQTSIILQPTVDVGTVNDGTKLKVADKNSIFGSISWLLENPEEMKVMGARGRENVMKRFDLRNVATSWLNLYDELIPKDYNMESEVVKKIA